jgi:hypothetical protein
MACLAPGSALSEGLRLPRRARPRKSAPGAGNDQTGTMASKYDWYWAAHLNEISAALQAAAGGSAAIVDVTGVRCLGDRRSWHGVAEVCGREMTRSSMAHATSLGRIVAASGICAAWPERRFRFTIGATGALSVAIADQKPRRRQVAAGYGVGAEASGGRAANPLAGTGLGEHRSGPGISADSRAADTDRFYLLLGELARRVGGPRLLCDCTGAQDWPRHGVYFFFEDGESRANGSCRVVRVGTHALTPTSRTTLWDRLRQHRGHLKGRNFGGGNHRASVFRRHVGAALIRRGNQPEELLGSWLDRHHPTQWADQEDEIEREVSRHIGAMPFLWLSVPDRADRGCIERNSIALLSCLAGCQDSSSAGWLGHDANRPQIRESGLWNVQYVYDRYDPAFLQFLARLVQSTNDV